MEQPDKWDMVGYLSMCVTILNLVVSADSCRTKKPFHEYRLLNTLSIGILGVGDIGREGV